MARFAVVLAAAALLIAAGVPPTAQRPSQGNGPERWRSPITGHEYRVRKLDPRGYRITGRGGTYGSFQEVIDAEIQASGIAPDLFKADAALRRAFLDGARGTRRVILVLEAQPIADEAPVIWDRDTPELERLSAELRAERDTRRRQALAAELKARRDAARDDIFRAALPALTESQAAAIAALGRVGVPRATPLTRTLNTLLADIAIEQLDRITGLVEIKRVAGDHLVHHTLDVSVPSTRIQPFRFHQIDGSSSVVAVIDTGVDFSHPALAGPSDQNHVVHTTAQGYDCYDDNTSPDDLVGHGTHIAGIVRSAGSTGFTDHVGMAPAVRLINLKSGFRTSQTTSCQQLHPGGGAMFDSDAMANIDWAVLQASPKADVISYSWGSHDGEYAGTPMYLDTLPKLLHVVVAVSASNEGPGQGTVSDQAAAFNVLTVGAADDHGTTYLGDDDLAPFSSWGPTPDGRFKPDLVAPGMNIVSASNTWEGPAADFVSKDGTSMAAPHAAGAAALALDGGLLWAKQIKSTLMNAASHTMFGDSSFRSITLGQGFLDLILHYGWYVDSDFYGSGIVSATSPRFFHVSPPIAAVFDRFTLLWEHGEDFNYADDLDLEVWSETTGTKLVSSGSSVDNVEFLLGLHFNQAFDNVFKVKAFALNPGTTDVPFALASSFFIYQRTPPNLDITSIGIPAQMNVNTFYPVTVTVENTGGLRARSVTLQIQGSPGVIVSPSSPQVIASIAAGGTGSKTYQVKGGNAACGAALVQVTGFSQSYGETYFIPSQNGNTMVACP